MSRAGDARVLVENRPQGGARAVIVFSDADGGVVSRISRLVFLWVALALVGLVVAIGVSYAASQLSKPTVGLASEPISRVTELAPTPAQGKDRPRSRSSTDGSRCDPRHPRPHPAPPDAPGPTAPLFGRQRRE